MNIKYNILIALLVVVTGCSNNEAGDSEISSSESQIESQSQEVIEESDGNEESTQTDADFQDLVSQLEDAPSLIPEYAPLITTDTFINDQGMEGWRDFEELSKEYKLADFGDIENTEGSHPDDILSFFEGKNHVQIHDYGEEEGSRQIDFRYLNSDGSEVEDTEMPAFFSRIVTSFVDDKLVFASVQPGMHSMDPNTAMPFSVVTDQVTSLADLIAVEPAPYVFSVSEMQYKGLPLTNAGVLTESPEEVDLEAAPLLVYFTFAPDVSSENEAASTLIAVDTSPFSTASRDFAVSSFNAMLSISEYIDQQS